MTRAEAERHTILRGEVGSGAHGVSIAGTDDRDEMGVMIEAPDFALGFTPFEQFIYRDATERTGKLDAPSQPGDLDLTIFSLRKYLHLALKGNPTILNLLFQQNPGTLRTELGEQLQALVPKIISRKAAGHYLGYMTAQRERLLGLRGQLKVKRPLLIEAYGFDTKYAMHMLRLGMQGVELLETGRIELPMDPPKRDLLLRVRQGQVTKDEVMSLALDLENRLKALQETSFLRYRPDAEAVGKWMVQAYLSHWDGVMR